MQVTNEEVAKLIMREYALAKTKSYPMHDISFGPRESVNKAYLAATIRSTESHNRREEVAQCWREKELLDKVESRTKRARCDRVQDHNYNKDEQQRSFWADKKASAMLRSAEVDSSIPRQMPDKSSDASSKSSSEPISDNEHDDSKDAKRERKEKKKRKKHKHKHKHKSDKNKKSKNEKSMANSNRDE